MSTRNWSLAGKAVREIDFILLTVMLQGKYWGWSEHFVQAYVSNRCKLPQK